VLWPIVTNKWFDTLNILLLWLDLCETDYRKELFYVLDYAYCIQPGVCSVARLCRKPIGNSSEKRTCPRKSNMLNSNSKVLKSKLTSTPQKSPNRYSDLSTLSLNLPTSGNSSQDAIFIDSESFSDSSDLSINKFAPVANFCDLSNSSSDFCDD
jgi:hypothetical protein